MLSLPWNRKVADVLIVAASGARTMNVSGAVESGPSKSPGADRSMSQ